MVQPLLSLVGFWEKYGQDCFIDHFHFFKDAFNGHQELCAGITKSLSLCWDKTRCNL
jgi:hypothetical protein